MKKRFGRNVVMAVALMMPMVTLAASAIKDGVGTDLGGNTVGVWTGGTGANGSPAAADTATWNSGSLGAGLKLEEAASWGGIRVSAALTDIDISGAGLLTLGSSGVNLSDSTVNLALDVPVTLNANQTWNMATGKTMRVSETVGGDVTLIKTGAGMLELAGINTHTGTNTLREGVLRADDGAGLAANRYLLFDGSGVLETRGTFTRMADTSSDGFGNKVGWVYGTTSKGGGFAARGGPLTVNLGGAATPTRVVWYQGSHGANRISGILRFGSPTANDAVTVLNPIDINNEIRYIHVTAGEGGDSVELAGAITDTVTSPYKGTLTKLGDGVLTLSGTNTFGNSFTVAEGTLNLAGMLSLQSSVLNMNGGEVTFDSRETGNTFAVGGISATQAGSGYDIALSNSLANAVTLVVSNAVTNVTYAATLSGPGGLTKRGAAVLTLVGTNTYTGPTTIAAGRLHAHDGEGVPTNSILIFDGETAVLETHGLFTRPVDGATTATGNKVRWVAGDNSKGGGFAARGGPLTVNLGGATPSVRIPWYQGSDGGVRISGVLRLGSATSDNRVTLLNPIDLNNMERIVAVTPGIGPEGGVAELAGNITDVQVEGKGGRLFKRGFGKLILSGTNTYPGTTAVGDGPLLINGDHSSATGNVTVARTAMFGGTGSVGGRVIVNGGILSAADTNTVGTLTLTDLTLGDGSTVQVDEAGGVFDRLALSGTLTAGTNVTVRLNVTGKLPSSLVVATAAGGIVAPENLASWRLEGGESYSSLVWRPSTQALVVSSPQGSVMMLQ